MMVLDFPDQFAEAPWWYTMLEATLSWQVSCVARRDSARMWLDSYPGIAHEHAPYMSSDATNSPCDAQAKRGAQ